MGIVVHESAAVRIKFRVTPVILSRLLKHVISNGTQLFLQKRCIGRL